MNTRLPEGLLDRILKRIHKEGRFLFLRRAIIFSAMMVGSLVSIVPSSRMLVSDFNNSGFINFIFLIFSDFSVVVTSWQNFAMIILETLPALSMVIFMTVVLVFLQSARYLTKNLYEYKQYFGVKAI